MSRSFCIAFPLSMFFSHVIFLLISLTETNVVESLSILFMWVKLWSNKNNCNENEYFRIEKRMDLWRQQQTATTTKDIDKYLSKNRLAFQVRSHDEIQIIFHSNSKYMKNTHIQMYIHIRCYTQTSTQTDLKEKNDKFELIQNISSSQSWRRRGRK